MSEFVQGMLPVRVSRQNGTLTEPEAHRNTQYKEFDFGDIVVRSLSGP